MSGDKPILQPITGGLAVLLIFVFAFSSYAGLASKYPGDEGIENDPAVVFAENFEEGSIAAIASRWEDSERTDIMSLVTDVPPGSAGEQSLLITHTGGDGTGAMFYRRLLPGYEKLYFRFYTKFDPDCNPIHHFVRMGGYENVYPWPYSHEKFATAIDPFKSDWRWDFYTYWEEMRSYNGGTYGNDFINDDNFSVERGKWICVEFMMKMNDPVTERNGEQALWIDGKCWMKDGQIVSHLGEGFPNGYWIWDSFYPNPGADPFEGFLWRTDEERLLNWIWLSLYISTAPTGHVSKVWFDDVVVATEYIGPINQTDFDTDRDVDFADYAVLASHWLDETCDEPTWCDGADLDTNGSVDLYDLARFVEYWLIDVNQ